MIYKLGNEYLGLNGLFTSILQVLSLAELGFGDAIVFSMYKPIIENDNKMLSALLNLYKKVYRIIGKVILCVGLLILPFIKKFEKANILLVLEIRTDIKKCDDFLADLIKDVPILYITEIKEFDSMELNQYFEYKYKNVFSIEEERSLKKILPKPP